jgi:hypothetical protein
MVFRYRAGVCGLVNAEIYVFQTLDSSIFLPLSKRHCINTPWLQHEPEALEK